MKRREFLASGIGSLIAASALQDGLLHARMPSASASSSEPPCPRETKLHVKPVMTNIIHTGVWEGPCRWRGVAVEDERKHAANRFASWSEQLRKTAMGTRADVKLLDPVQITFCEDFKIRPEQFEPLSRDAEDTDVFFLHPAGSSLSAFEIGDRFQRPILLQGLGCRNVDIAAYTTSRGNEAFVAADHEEFDQLLSLLRARKVFRQTSVLFPTDRGLPAVCSVGSIWDLKDLQQRLGVRVKTVSYQELADEMDTVTSDTAAMQESKTKADRLVERADRTFLDKKYVAKSLLFYRAVRNLMARHGCNAFTIECFEFCSSRLPDQWQVTPCLIHSLHRDLGHASSCEGDLGSLLAMRMLMSVGQRSCHQGNSDPRGEGTFRINHSVPALKMNGYDQPDLPYQLGRFVSKGWGTKVLVDFLRNEEKTVTVARVDPTARKLLLLRGEVVGSSGWDQDNIGCSSGWDQDNIGCSVEALIRPPEGRLDEFLRDRLEYGNHLQWIYGDFVEDMQRLGQMIGLEVKQIA
jgi:hypothetical protein